MIELPWNLSRINLMGSVQLWHIVCTAWLKHWKSPYSDIIKKKKKHLNKTSVINDVFTKWLGSKSLSESSRIFSSSFFTHHLNINSDCGLTRGSVRVQHWGWIYWHYIDYSAVTKQELWRQWDRRWMVTRKRWEWGVYHCYTFIIYPNT